MKGETFTQDRAPEPDPEDPICEAIRARYAETQMGGHIEPSTAKEKGYAINSAPPHKIKVSKNHTLDFQP